MDIFLFDREFLRGGRCVHVPDPARGRGRHRDRDRALHHAHAASARKNREHVDQARARARERRLRQGAGDDQQGRLRRSSRLLGMGLARQGAVRRRDDIEIAMEESMMEIIPQLEKRTHYLALVREHRDAARPAGHRHRPDPGVHRGGERQPGGEGQPAVGQHLGGDEQHGLRPDRRDAAARDRTRSCRPRRARSSTASRRPRSSS